MNNPNQNMLVDNIKNQPAIGSIKQDYPTEVEEICRQELKQFDSANCRARTYVTGLVECLSPQFCHSCNHSMPFASKYFCKHPLVARRIADDQDA